MRYKRGLVLGKFMPPHAGHQHLISVAASLCETLCITVGTQPSEDLSGALRYRWMKQLNPDHHVVHLHREMPQLPSEHPQFWTLWRDALAVAGPVDVVVAGEPYGAGLAEVLGADFIQVPRVDGVSISGTAIRANARECWPFLAPVVRRWYAIRVRVVGPESAGKTTLSKHLATVSGAAWVPEFARSYLEARAGSVSVDDLPLIARAQAASEDAIATHSDGAIVTDTDPMLTALWSRALFGHCAAEIWELAQPRRYHLTLLLAPTERWVADPVRYQPDVAERVAFYQDCQRHYPDAVVLDGPWSQRTEHAERALREVLRWP